MRADGATRRFASGDWLTPSLALFTAALMSVGTIAALAFMLATADGPLDIMGRPIGTDFASFWTAGRMAIDGMAAQAYDWSSHFAVQRELLGNDKYFPWSYPPVFLLLASLFAALPYLPAFLAWQGASLAAAATAYWNILPFRRALLFGFGFPAVFICLGHGQTGFLTAALMAGGLLALRRHEVLAGILFGLLAYKPQFGVLLPFVLAAGGYWRAFAAAAATVCAVIALSLAVFGWPVWAAFIDSLGATRSIVFEAGDTGFEKFQSAFALVRLWRGPAVLAYAIHGLVALAVAASVIWVWRVDAPFRLQAAALLAGSLLVSPYTLDYDFVVFGMALALIFAHGLERGFRDWDKTLLALGWIAPLLARTFAKTVYLPVGLFMLVAIFLLIVVRIRDERLAGAHVTRPSIALT